MPRIDHRASRGSFEQLYMHAPSVPTRRACPGRCNDRWRAAEQVHTQDGAPHDLVPIDGNPVWCTSCRNRLYYALLGMPYLTVLVQLEVAHATRAEAERVSGTGDAPLHDREAYTLLIDTVWSTLTGYEDQVRYERVFSPRPRAVRRGRALQDAAVFLTRQVDWFLHERPDDDEGPDPETGRRTETSARGFADRIAALERRLQRATHQDERRPEDRPTIPCPDCDLMALEYELDFEKKATGLTRCRACRTRHTPERIARWLSLLADHGRRWPTDLREFYDIPEPTDAQTPGRPRSSATETVAAPAGGGHCILDGYGACQTHSSGNEPCPTTEIRPAREPEHQADNPGAAV